MSFNLTEEGECSVSVRFVMRTDRAADNSPQIRLPSMLRSTTLKLYRKEEAWKSRGGWVLQFLGKVKGD